MEVSRNVLKSYILVTWMCEDSSTSHMVSLYRERGIRAPEEFIFHGDTNSSDLNIYLLCGDTRTRVLNIIIIEPPTCYILIRRYSSTNVQLSSTISSYGDTDKEVCVWKGQFPCVEMGAYAIGKSSSHKKRTMRIKRYFTTKLASFFVNRPEYFWVRYKVWCAIGYKILIIQLKLFTFLSFLDILQKNYEMASNILILFIESFLCINRVMLTSF